MAAPAIAELFVSIGVKGEEKTLHAMGAIKTGLSDAKGLAFETKAAILGIAYALEKITSTGVQKAVTLSNVVLETGQKSSKALQKLIYSARMGHDTEEGFLSSYKSLYKKTQDMKFNEPPPKMFQNFAQNVKGFDQKKFMHDINYAWSAVEQFAANKHLDPSLKRRVLENLGIGSTTIDALMRGSFNTKNKREAPVISDSGEAKLVEIETRWTKLKIKMEHDFDQWNADHGLQLTKDIEGLLPPVERLFAAFAKFGDAIKIFERIDTIFKGWTFILNYLADKISLANGMSPDKQTDTTKAFDKKMGEIFGSPEDKNVSKEESERVLNDAVKGQQELERRGGKWLKEKLLDGKSEWEIEADKIKQQKNLPVNPSHSYQIIVPKMPYIPSELDQSKTQNVAINNNNYFQHPGLDHDRTTQSFQKAVATFYKQTNTQQMS